MYSERGFESESSGARFLPELARVAPLVPQVAELLGEILEPLLTQ
jgi:hypothetical protein